MAVIPPARGGRALPVKPKAPKLRRIAAPKPITPENAAMTTFRAALQQLNQAVAPVNTAAIQAPYDAASVATAGLGEGLAANLVATGQQAQDQYTQGFKLAQQAAASFGISAGAGANPTVLENTGTGYLANRTQADTSAAASATTAWQQLLARTSAAKVADAQTQRQGVIDQGRASLSANLPSLIGSEKDRAFQKKTARDNMGLAYSQLTAKQQSDAQQYGLDYAKAAAGATSDAEAARIKRAQLAQKTRTDAAKVRVSQETLALKRRTAAASAAGLKGVASVAKALTSVTSTKPGTKKTPKGWDVTYQVLDPDTGEPTGDTRTIRQPRKDRNPDTNTYKFVSALTHYETLPTSGGSASLTARSWDTYFRSLLAQNPGRTAEVKAFLGARPKK